MAEDDPLEDFEISSGDDPGPPAAPGSLLELKVSSAVRPDASLPVSWCVTPELRTLIEERKILNPFLLISVYSVSKRPDWKFNPRTNGNDRVEVDVYRETKRYLVPLTDPMAYVAFSRPGRNEVRAMVVYNPEGEGRRTLEPVFTRRHHGGGYANQLFFDNGDSVGLPFYVTQGRRHNYEGRVLDKAEDTFEIAVDAEHFAKPYPQWITTYLTKFFSTKPFDQCHQRKRWWFFGLPALPLFLLTGAIVRVDQMIFGLWIGKRGLRFKNLFHPIRTDVAETWGHDTNLRWWKTKDGGWRHPIWWALQPVTPIPLALIVFVLQYIQVHYTGSKTRSHQWYHIGFLRALWLVVLAHLGLVTLGVMVAAVVSFVAFAIGVTEVHSKLATALGMKIGAFFDYLGQRVDERFEARVQAQHLIIMQELQDMTCGQWEAPGSYEEVPEGKRSYHLWKQATKAKVCKPFAQ